MSTKFKFHLNLKIIAGNLQEEPIYTYDNISLISSQNDKCFTQTL